MPAQRRHPGSIFVIPGPHPGLLIAGNLNLWQRPVIRNGDGSYSTVKSVSWPFWLDRKGFLYPEENRPPGSVRRVEVLMPEAIGNAVVGPKAARQHFISSGQHLGIFDSPAHATSYAIRLHNWFVTNAKWFVPPRRK